MSVKPIETEYKGYKFRSRLEARWAVFFDNAEIRYEYEPEGYEVDWYEKPTRYLPDFYLLDFDVYCEVKPNNEKLFEESEKIGVCIDYLNTPISSGLVLLGPVPYADPEDDVFAAHDMLYWNKGVVLKRIRFKMRRHGYPTELITVCDGIDYMSEGIPVSASVDATFYEEDDFCHWMTLKDLGIEWPAYKAARQARFEHGEKPR